MDVLAFPYALSVESDRVDTSSCVRNVWFASTAALVVLTLLVWMPAGIDFGLAVGAAVSWCRWLEQHPAD
jgi:hypothetical protein